MNHITQFKEKLSSVKEQDQDFEWYPTTKEMIETVFLDVKNADMSDKNDLLDIGAGDGNLFAVWEELYRGYYPKDDWGNRPNIVTVPRNYFAIEKSQVLIEYLPKEVIVLGTEFYTESLIDKPVDIIFTNPPYTEFIPWIEKTILQANARLLYMVVPERWKESIEINNALKKRGAGHKVIYEGDFLDGPRAARAKINIVKIDFRGDLDEILEKAEITSKVEMHKRFWYSRGPQTDPFDIWFNDEFPGFDKWDNEELKEKPFKEKLEMTKGSNLIERLELLYQNEMEHLKNVFSTLQNVDPSLLREMEISLDSVIKKLKMKLKGAKHRYWEELFSNLTKITDRLTQKSRKKLLATLQGNREINFTAKNAYAVVIWAIKHANGYYDEQLIDAYENLVNGESIKGYKSNHRFSNDDWKFRNVRDFMDKESRYFVNDERDYRIVCHRVGGISDTESYWCNSIKGLNDRAYHYIQDLCTLANNLGYQVNDGALNVDWTSGEMKTFYKELPGEHKIGDKTRLGKIEDRTADQYKIKGEWYHKRLLPKEAILFTVRAYKNGNLHFKFDQEFLRKWNVEFGRLKGWINNKHQASEELNIPMEEMKKLYSSNFRIETSNPALLLEKAV